jgi:hypothetical protein
MLTRQIIVAITVIVIVKWNRHLDTFNGITKLIVALGVTVGVCSSVTRTSLVPEILLTFRHQLYGDRDIAAAFLPHQGQAMVQGLIVVTNLVTHVVFILWCFGCTQDWWQSMSMQFVILAGEYCHFLQLAA